MWKVLLILMTTLAPHSLHATESAKQPLSHQHVHFAPQRATLPNGLQVVVIENHLTPVITTNLIYKIGTADDPIDQIGLSHFLEHLMFKGTESVPTGLFKRRIIEKGGEINAYTTADTTVYTCTIAKVHLDMVLAMEADRMHNLLIDPAEVDSERNVVMEERRMRVDNNPLGAASEVVLRALHTYHPYGIPVIGYPHHIRAYTAASARQHYETWYRPNNAILVIVGDVTMAEVLPLVEKHFGALQARDIPVRQRDQNIPVPGVRQHITIENPRVSYVSYQWYYRAPHIFGTDKELCLPTVLLHQILGGNDISRLYENLVEENHDALFAGTSYSLLNLDPEFFTINLVLEPTKELDRPKAMLESIVQDILKNGVSEAELTAAKRDLLANLAFTKDGLNSAARYFEALGYGVSIEEILSYPERLNAVTVEQVSAAARALLTANPVLTVLVCPQGHPLASSKPVSSGFMECLKGQMMAVWSNIRKMIVNDQ